MILSRQILVTKFSNPIIIHNLIFQKLDIAIEQFDINDLQYFFTVLKYKSVEIEIDSFNKFS